MLTSFAGITPHNLPPSTVFQIEASSPASYPGSGQSFFNIWEHPADGSAKSAYDFWLGRDNTVTTDDPTFVTNKFTADGGDIFEIKSTTSFLSNLIRTDLTNSWWSAAAFLAATSGAVQTLYGTSNGSNVPGWRVDINATPNIRLIRADGTLNNTNNLQNMTGLIGIPVLHVFVWDNSTQNYKTAINSKTFSTGAATAFPQTNSNTGKLNLGGANHGSQKISAGSELYGMAMGTGTLSNADLAVIVNYYNALHGRIYA